MEIKNRQVVVTGGAGFVGSHVVDRLVAAGNQVAIIDDFSTGSWENIRHHQGNPKVRVHQADILDLDTMVQLLEGADVVFHLAVACVRASINSPRHVHDVNATGTLNMCRAALHAGVKRFVYVSSAEVYGSAVYAPMDEAHPLNPTNVYGAAKAVGELYAVAHWHTYGLPIVITRLCNSYGPREHSEGVCGEVIPRFVMRAMAGLPPVIFGDGEQRRDFTWVEETVQGIVLAAECDELIGDRVNIARGQEVSIKEICAVVLDKLGRTDLTPVHLESGRPGDVDRVFADIGKARRLLGFSPIVDIRTGIERYIDWVLAQEPDVERWAAKEAVVNW